MLALAASGSLGLGGALYITHADADTGHKGNFADSPQSSSSRGDPTPLPPPAGDAEKKKVVVLGTGWGGMSFVRGIDTSKYDVTVVSPRNYFLFTPLLPGVSSGSMEGRSISEPIRRIMLRHKKQGRYFEAECIDMDPANKTVTCQDSDNSIGKVQGTFTLPYDYLIIAVGAQSNTFGTPGVLEHCHCLKELEDAERIRESVVDCFEAAALPNVSDEERKRLLNFVVVGGGPTGVEFAAELHDLVQDDLSKLYPQLVPITSIVLIQSADHILNMFDKRISDFAQKKFSRDKLDVRVNARVVAVGDKAIQIRNKATKQMEDLEYGMIVWSTGIGTRPLISSFMQKVGQGDRRALGTDEWLRVKGCHDVWALGDCASIEHRRMQEDISLLFKMTDVDNDGHLSFDELYECMQKLKERYPQISLYLKRKTFRDLLKGWHPDQEPENQGVKNRKKMKLRIEDFQSALKEVDDQMKTLPATAQVAAQQGDYLANCFNSMAKSDVPEGPIRVRGTGRHRFRPFVYTHLGQFAPLGSGEAGVELPGDWVNVGRSTQWLWYSVYASKQVSWRTRFLVVFDWTKLHIFGRDSSRM